MAIALPPPIPPQQAPLAELRAEAGHQPSLLIDYGAVHLRIFASRLLPERRLREAVATADNLSDAVREIGYSYYSAGYPAALVSYAAETTAGVTVYVRVVPGRVTRLSGGASVRHFFDDLPRHAPLTDAQLEADRAAADALASRAGERYQPSFTPIGGDAVALDLGEAGEGEPQTSAAASFNNYGNRYAGPYLGNLGLRQSFTSGDELTLTGAASLRFLGLGGGDSSPYHGVGGSWTHVFGLGQPGLQGGYADFQETVGGVTFKGQLHELAASWQQVLYTSFRQRLSLGGRLLHDHEALGQPDQPATVSCDPLSSLLAELGLATCQTVRGGGDAFSETYHSAELSLAWVWRSLEQRRGTEVQTGLLLRKGFSSGDAPGSNADLSYLLWQPSLSIRYGLGPGWNLLAGGTAQFSDAVLPQQQQFVIGGPYSLHAFRAGAATGDRGESASLAVEWKPDPGSTTGHLGLRPRLFVEYASARHRRPTLGEPAGTVSLADAGLSLDVQPLPQLGASLSLGRPILKQGAQNSPDQLQTRLLYFQLTAKF
jgi:hemolysin activation/secretion protein